jgi:hypothetical protein
LNEKEIAHFDAFVNPLPAGSVVRGQKEDLASGALREYDFISQPERWTIRPVGKVLWWLSDKESASTKPEWPREDMLTQIFWIWRRQGEE